MSVPNGQRVLVAYGTKYGSTAEIAEWIGAALREGGLDADVRPAADVVQLRGYAAVVLGGALYAGRWHRDATRFARRHRRALANTPLWLFSSGPLDKSASERSIPPTRGVARLITRLDAREHRTFGGCLGENASGFVAGRLVKSGAGGDFRDREEIRQWGRGIAREVAAMFESL